MTFTEKLFYENLRLNSEFIKDLETTRQQIQERALTATDTYNEGDYTIRVNHYSDKNLETRYCDILQINVFKGEKKICDFTRNYHGIDFCLVSQHGEDFLITSEDYQALTIINLTTGVISTYGDWQAIKDGIGWCPIDIDFDDDEIILGGCYWSGPYEYYYIPASDLNNPDFTSVTFSTEYEQEDVEEDEEEDNDDSDC